MQLSLYQIDAFAERPFEGNPAAVVPLKEWLPDETLRAIARKTTWQKPPILYLKETGIIFAGLRPTRKPRCADMPR